MCSAKAENPGSPAVERQENGGLDDRVIGDRDVFRTDLGAALGDA